MMLPTYTDLAARQEQHQDRLRRAEYRRMLDRSGIPSSVRPGHRQAISWLGTQLVALGARLQQYGAGRQVIVADRGAGYSR